VTNCLDCEVRVVEFVHQIQNTEGGEGDYQKNESGEDSSYDFNVLRVEGVQVSEAS